MGEGEGGVRGNGKMEDDARKGGRKVYLKIEGEKDGGGST